MHIYKVSKKDWDSRFTRKDDVFEKNDSDKSWAVDQLQEFAIKNGGFHLKNLRWFCPDLGTAIQDQIDTINK